MNEITQENKSMPIRKKGGTNYMNRRKSNVGKFAGSKIRRRMKVKKAQIKYKKTSREKAAKLLAAQDLAQRRATSNAFNIPDWIDHDALWDVFRKNPLTFNI